MQGAFCPRQEYADPRRKHPDLAADFQLGKFGFVFHKSARPMNKRGEGRRWGWMGWGHCSDRTHQPPEGGK